ncbi:heme biosynthesis protein HemY [Allorhizobium sp. BGMRC 0089]|uniref:heme biosynthesis protein HemY n=1 Tax=Allorhizobium sonneratiae TaxID=2934936 RepID=UPI0020341559|nr:heme biosynthesis protein HemY [Allorhizobium sonneratiae]MCM2293429.1 heme biosynthesis protein HemY [Allorhizobium sonneratiae]
MIRIISYVLLILVLGFGFSWLADRPGDVEIVFQGQQIDMSLTVAAAIVAALIAVVMILWWLLRTLWTSPHSVRRYFRARKRDRGYKALSTGLIAAGAGNAQMARRMSSRAKGLISSSREPLILMLEAEAALIEGKHDEARRLFEQMVGDSETREYGLRGLYLEASRAGAHEAARQYAEKAAEEAPYLPWAAKATLEHRCRNGEWDEAIHLLDRQRIAHGVRRAEADRLKAVLLTAKAVDQLDGDPAGARDNAINALKLAKGFVPAAVTAARALIREDNLRKAASVLESAWKQEPHPEVARVYARARPGDGALDRLKRAERLEHLKPNNVESLLVVAEMALEAHDFNKARSKAEAAARLSPSERVFLLLADIEDIETGDQARIRYWMAQALKAPRDPAWVADGQVSESWRPFSPVSGRIDAFEWKVPYAQLSGPVEDGHVISGAAMLADLPPLAQTAAAPAETVAQQPVTTAGEPAARPATVDGAGPFHGRPPDDPGVKDPNRTDEKVRLNLY